MHLDDLVSHQAVRTAMYLRCRLRIRRLDEAGHLARALVEPVLQVTHSKLVLRLEIGFVGAFDRIRGQTVDVVVDVHVQRHQPHPFLRVWGIGRRFPGMSRRAANEGRSSGA